MRHNFRNFARCCNAAWARRRLSAVELGDVCDWHTDRRDNDLGSPETSGDVGMDIPESGAAGRLRSNTRTRAPLISRHEARQLTNALAGFDLHFERDISPNGALLHRLRRDDHMLEFTRRAPVMRARSSFEKDLAVGRIFSTRQDAGNFRALLRAVHNRSIGQETVAKLAKDPALECTTSTLIECLQKLRA